MRIPLEWLKECVPVRLAPKALAERLTMAGLEVVGIEEGEHGVVFDLEITPNRADCLSIIGVAREVAAITGQRLKLPLGHGTRDMGQANRKTASRPTSHVPRPKVVIEDRTGCSRYIGRLIEGVTVKPSPEWVQRRLLACGARPINNLVDITNYVLLEYGQPLHAFDFDRLAEGTIVVRRARANESITTLDGTRHTLPSEALLIADAARPVAVAGVMGGTGSEVTPKTRRVLLESARFDPLTVRRTARRLGLASESSYRFERGVDPSGVEAASRRAAALIQQLAGGQETAVCDAGTATVSRSAIPLDLHRAAKWLGTRIDSPAARTTLARLSCRVASGSGTLLRVTPPSFRQDLTREVDLYEELARLIGYDRIPATLPSVPIANPDDQPVGEYWRLTSLRCLCASLGLTEAVTWSLVSASDLARCQIPAATVARLANPLSQDHAYVRPSLLIGLLQAVRQNLTQGALGVRLFEVGNVMAPKEVAAQRERVHLGLALAGAWSRDWQGTAACDFFRLKGLVQGIVGRLCAGGLQFVRTDQPWAQPGACADIQLEGRTIGVAAQVSSAIAQALDLDQPIWFGELSVDALLRAKRQAPVGRAPSLFPPVKRDLSILVGDATPFHAIEQTIHDIGGALAGRAELIDRYLGQPIPPGKASLTISLEYRDPSRTLTAAEADAVHQRIGQALIERFGAALR